MYRYIKSTSSVKGTRGHATPKHQKSKATLFSPLYVLPLTGVIASFLLDPAATFVRIAMNVSYIPSSAFFGIQYFLGYVAQGVYSLATYTSTDGHRGYVQLHVQAATMAGWVLSETTWC